MNLCHQKAQKAQNQKKSMPGFSKMIGFFRCRRLSLFALLAPFFGQPLF
jgi:hypothetical protein